MVPQQRTPRWYFNDLATGQVSAGVQFPEPRSELGDRRSIESGYDTFEVFDRMGSGSPEFDTSRASGIRVAAGIGDDVMRDDDGMVVTADWGQDQTRNKRLRMLSGVGGTIALGALSLPAMVIGERVSSGVVAYFLSAGILVLFAIPLVSVLVLNTEKEQQKTDNKVQALANDLAQAVRTADREAGERDMQARRQRFESRLANALDMAEGEPEVIDVIERSFAAVLPEAPVELLFADNSHAHLIRMAGVGPDGEPPSCSVDSPDRCPAARRAQVQVFGDSDHLDACPKLRNRPQGRVSALCVPVSIMGRTVGVIHATDKPEAEVQDSQIQDLTTLAKLAGARIGLLRVMAETQLQASTDTLTGLLNRRSFSQKVADLPHDLYPVAVAMADLDHFKNLNDTYGHETGDRALRLFARVLRDTLRAHDLISRYGGEEFAIAFPDCSSVDATRALNTVQAQLDAAITVGGLPKFTSSFGITEIEPGEELAAALRRADDALLVAKRSGRDQVVLHDPGIPSNSPGGNGNTTHQVEELARAERI